MFGVLALLLYSLSTIVYCTAASYANELRYKPIWHSHSPLHVQLQQRQPQLVVPPMPVATATFDHAHAPATVIRNQQTPVQALSKEGEYDGVVAYAHPVSASASAASASAVVEVPVSFAHTTANT